MSARACRTCSDMDELKARLEWLEGELGLREEADAIHALRTAWGVPPAAARLGLILYRARGKTVLDAQVAEAMPERDHVIERDDAHVANVYVCRLRKALGKDGVETVYGQGYRLTQVGLQRVAAVLGEGGA